VGGSTAFFGIAAMLTRIAVKGETTGGISSTVTTAV
jgi:hypothetical protein